MLATTVLLALGMPCFFRASTADFHDEDLSALASSPFLLLYGGISVARRALLRLSQGLAAILAAPCLI